MTDETRSPVTPTPQGNYVTAVVHDGMAISAGMTPRVGGSLAVTGIIGADLTVEEGRRAASIAASNALLAIAQAGGGLDQIDRCLQMTVYLVCTADFTRHSTVADGASVSLDAWLGARGKVARAAIGVLCLPSGAPVEVTLTAALRR
ncbi:MAG TPA: RidA family protein [Amycolatopsis sp.]|nr:RidA family protein [Amycolatopsis sp.]